MRNKLINIISLLVLTGILIHVSLEQNCQGTGEIRLAIEKAMDLDSRPETRLSEKVSETVTELFSQLEAEIRESEKQAKALLEREMEELSKHYGTYRITEYLYTIYTSRNDHITDQEADMMLGRIVEITPERLVTYGPERGLGTRNGRYCFTNYMVENYSIDNPNYQYEEKQTGDTLMGMELDYVAPDLSEQLEGVITTPQLSEPFGWQEFYTFTDKDVLVLCSQVAGEHFLLERCEEEPKAEHPKWNSMEVKDLLEEIYGAYQVTRFLPTKFFPFEDHHGEELSQEEADMTIGRIVTISKDLFVTIDNWRFNRNRPWVAEAEVVNPDYRVKTVWADEIYGIRDGMLPENLAQQEYVEVSVYPGYRSGILCDSLPQLYLINDGRILLYSMGQYFLLERTEDEKAAVHEKDLSSWLGSYIYTDYGEETNKYKIEIQEKDSGEYEADIKLVIEEEGKEIKVKAYVYGNKEKISIVFKEKLTENKFEFVLNGNKGDVLLRFCRDMETGDIYTYWGELKYDGTNLDTSDKEAGKICFVKE